MFNGENSYNIVTMVVFSILCWVLNCAVVNETEIKFYTYINAPNFTALQVQIDNLSAIALDPTKPLRILTHGWRQTYEAHWIEPAISAYYKNDHISNVIVVDWSKYGYNLYYPYAARDTEPVGEIVGRFILEVCDKFGIPLWNVHLVGSSLGAHLFGFAGKLIYSKAGQRVGRITALDPAALNFENESPAKRLAKSDANFVDAIHTNIFIVGFQKPLGHIDYYPNGGNDQPGCRIVLYDLACSHRRAALYYVESINSYSFKAWKCENYSMYQSGECANNLQITLGDSQGLSYDSEGTYFLKTNRAAPFGCNC